MILEDIVEKRREQLTREKAEVTPDRMKKQALALGDKGHLLEKVLQERDFILITEVKKASPSKGIISDNFQPLATAKAYEEGGATALSVLTEEAYFQGSNEFLKEIARAVSLPILRKDFVIDSFQIYHARVLGASAILLIAGILSKVELVQFIEVADELGLDALVEVHTLKELRKAIAAGARIIGINNRNLKTFEVSLEKTLDLITKVPKGIPVISESGFYASEQVRLVREQGVRGILVGEALMKHGNITQGIKELLG